MTFTDINYRAFAQAELDSYNLSDYNLDQESALEELANGIEKSIANLNKLEAKKKRHKLFNVLGSCDNDYQEHLINLTGEKAVICGIRHMNLNAQMPYVNLRPNFLIKSREHALEIYEKIKESFIVFKPKYLCFHSAKSLPVEKLGNLYMAAKTEEVLQLSAWPLQDILTFKKIEDESYYAWYEAEYKKFHRVREDLAHSVTINSQAIMNASMTEGLLYAVFEADRQIGLIAGERTDFMGKKALYINDIVVADGDKGRGLAKALQKKFIEIHADEFELVFGTIDSSNKPSLNTAKANARKSIRFENFVKI